MKEDYKRVSGTHLLSSQDIRAGGGHECLRGKEWGELQGVGRMLASTGGKKKGSVTLPSDDWKGEYEAVLKPVKPGRRERERTGRKGMNKEKVARFKVWKKGTTESVRSLAGSNGWNRHTRSGKYVGPNGTKREERDGEKEKGDVCQFVGKRLDGGLSPRLRDKSHPNCRTESCQGVGGLQKNTIESGGGMERLREGKGRLAPKKRQKKGKRK